MSTLLFYTLCWFILMIIAILNGMLREMTYKKWMREIRAHQLSTFTGMGLIGIVVWKLNQYIPITSSNEALQIGVIWLVMTILFEFIFGHYVMNRSWEFLFRDYRIDKGRVWGLLLIWVLLSPIFIYTYF